MSRYVIGIDLGTTNSVLCYAKLDESPPQIRRLAIPQLTAPNQIERLSSLPSFIHFTDRPASEAGLSLSEVLGDVDYGRPDLRDRVVIGQYAREISAQSPERTVIAAKSWLSATHVDRGGDILPPTEDLEEGNSFQQISPVLASRILLQHLAAAWQESFPDSPIAEQTLVLTVPASFDVVAKELTVQAAREAGLPDDTVLLEEPQAALYHWIWATGEQWRRHLEPHQRVLIVDVGGGTTDLTMIEVAEAEGEMALQRVAVGKHLLLGGDNMDIATAVFAAEKFAGAGHKLNAWQNLSLWHAARQAKEALLSGEHENEYTISVLGRGSRLIGGTISASVRRDEIERVLLDGFFPHCERNTKVITSETSGFQQLGLQFETDTAITRHIADFLRRAATSGSGENAGQDGGLKGEATTHVLFNGGVFRGENLRRRAAEVIGHLLNPGGELSVLGEVSYLDAAVAYGAAYYGWAKRNGGVRIRGGTARSYYVGIEAATMAVPGIPRPVTALCVVPKGMEEGTGCDVPTRPIGLVVGRKANFRFFSSLIREEDRPGKALKFWDEDELQESSSLSVELPAEEGGETSGVVPVTFHSQVNELGLLELYCLAADGHRWKLELNVREPSDPVGGVK